MTTSYKHEGTRSAVLCVGLIWLTRFLVHTCYGNTRQQLHQLNSHHTRARARPCLWIALAFTTG